MSLCAFIHDYIVSIRDLLLLPRSGQVNLDFKQDTMFRYPSCQLPPIIYDTSYSKDIRLLTAQDKGGDENRAQGILQFIRSRRGFTSDSTY